MKPIHNSADLVPPLIAVVFNISKIQNETNSQPACIGSPGSNGCFQHFKDTK